MKRIYIKPKIRVIDDEMFDLCDSAPLIISKQTTLTDNVLDNDENSDIEEGGDAGAKGNQLWDDLSGW